ncbi:hypothetical protein GLYMA_17G107050v4 [Glycine max]|nr:hypothetical protein GYH30_046901 [Glycine max]KRH03584.2 hypothetical protein GLYMA_17G107050v4 [Glycine max]
MRNLIISGSFYIFFSLGECQCVNSLHLSCKKGDTFFFWTAKITRQIPDKFSHLK